MIWALTIPIRIRLGEDKHDNQEVFDQLQGSSWDAVYLEVVSHQSCFSLPLSCQKTNYPVLQIYETYINFHFKSIE